MSRPQKITKFDRPTCKAFSEHFEQAMKTFAQEFGLTVKLTGGRFDINSFVPKLTFHIPVVSEQGKVVNKKAMEDFQLWSPLRGIDPSAFGQKLKLSGKLYTITGWNTRSRVSPILIEDSEGKQYKVKAELVSNQFPLNESKTKKSTRK